MRPQICRDGEVRVERGRAQLLLHEGEVGRLPAHNGQQDVADRMAPWWQPSSVCGGALAMVAAGEGQFGRTVVAVLVARIEPRVLRRRALRGLCAAAAALLGGAHVSDSSAVVRGRQRAGA